MYYSLEPREGRYVKGYGFLSFAKKIGENVSKNISSKYSQKRIDSAKKSAIDAIFKCLLRSFRNAFN